MSDRIEKQVVIRAPRSRVWRAIVDQSEFGTWFLVSFPPGEFTEGKRVSGRITYPGYEHLTMEVEVVEVVPEVRLAYRWDAYPAEPGDEDPPKTLVTFSLEDDAEGTRLSLVESGFDLVPEDRREQAFRSNDGGWTEQMQNISRHVTASI